MERSYEKYFRQNRLPHLWCPGCGNGIAMKAIVQAIEKKGFPQGDGVQAVGDNEPGRAAGGNDRGRRAHYLGEAVNHTI